MKNLFSGLTQLRQDHVLITCNSLLLFGLALSSIFVNVYIWKVDRSFFAIGVFNLCVFAAVTAGFFVGGKLSSKWIDLWIMRFGLIALSLFFLALLILREHSAHYFFELGLLFGFGQGVYWYGFHVTMFTLTTIDNRASFNGANGFFASLVSMVAPFVAGFFISHSPQFVGYHVVFAVSLLLFALSFWLVFALPKGTLHRKLHLVEGFHLHADPDWRRLWIGSLLFGLREGVFAFYIGLLVYFAAKSEEGLGEYGLWTGLVSLAAFYIVRMIKKKERVRLFMVVSSILLGGIGLLFFLGVGRIVLILFGTVTALCMPFFIVPFSSMLMNEIDESKQSKERMPEYLISREIALGIGRVIGISIYLFIAFQAKPSNLIVLAVILGFAHTIVGLLIRSVTYEPRDRNNGSLERTSAHQASRLLRAKG